MSDDESYELLGFDNVLLPVGDLGEAVGFYERAGFAVGASGSTRPGSRC